MKVRIVIREYEGHYWAKVLGFPTIAVAGDTAASARREAVEALRMYLRLVGEALPTPTQIGEKFEIVDVRV